MRICFFPHYSFSNRAGGTLSMYNIIDGLLERGEGVTVVLPNDYHLEERLKDKRIDFIHVPMYCMRMTLDKLTWLSGFKFLVKYIHNRCYVGKIVAQLRARKIDCIHINGLDSSVGAIVAKKLKVPYVWHIRAFMEEDLGQTLFRKKETYKLVSEADAVIGISKDIKRKFEKELGREVRLVYNGVPREHYEIEGKKIFAGERTKLLLAGRIALQKGQLSAIRAVELLRSRGHKDVHLTIVGQVETKEYMEQVRSYIADHHLEDAVTIRKHTDNLRTLLESHDIGLICSKREAFGRVTVEYMMGGLLAIGADSGGTPEIIEDGVSGFLYKEGDAEDLERVIAAAVEHTEESRQVAKRGHQKALDFFSMERVITQVMEIYREITLVEQK